VEETMSEVRHSERKKISVKKGKKTMNEVEREGEIEKGMKRIEGQGEKWDH